MSDETRRLDLRRRAQEQAQYGNYWAGKVVGLLDEVRALRSVVRHSQIVDCYAEDGHDWTPSEEMAIRRALDERATGSLRDRSAHTV